MTGSKQEWYDEARHSVLLENFPVRGAFSQIYTSHEIYCCTRHTHAHKRTQTHTRRRHPAILHYAAVYCYATLLYERDALISGSGGYAALLLCKPLCPNNLEPSVSADALKNGATKEMIAAQGLGTVLRLARYLLPTDETRTNKPKAFSLHAWF
jgi:hypothetical protein